MTRFLTQVMWLTTITILLNCPNFSFGQTKNPDDIVDLPTNAVAPSVSMATGAGTKSGSINKTMQLYLVFENCPSYNTGANRTDIINNLNTIFGQIDLSFSLIGYEDVTDAGTSHDYWYNPSGSNQPTNFQPALVIVVENTSDPGRAQVGYPIAWIGANYYFNASTDYKRNLLGHEVGHCFGLMHPRFGTMYNFECDPMVRGEVDTSNCVQKRYFYNYTQVPELVDGSNGSTAGDFCADTEAQPSIFRNPITNELLTDANGDRYESLTQGRVMRYYTGSYYTYTDDQKRIMHNFVDNTIFNRTFRKTIACADASESNNVTATLTDYAPSSFQSKSWSITNNTGCVSINSSTGEITVTGNTYGIETVTCTITQKKVYQYGWTFTHTVTKDITVNPNPPAPSISSAYNTETYYYEANPLDTDVEYRFQMSNCGSSSSDSDYEWEHNGDALFTDGNGSYPYDDVATGKTCYLKGLFSETLTLKARYRTSSTEPWSYWKSKSVEFSGGMMMMIAPNPSSYSGETTISVMSTTSEPLDYNESYEIEIYDALSASKKIKTKVKKKDYKLKTHGWKAGTYIIVAKYKDKQVTGKLKVE